MEMVTGAPFRHAGSLYYGQASYGSRSLSVEGVAVQLAAQRIKDKARKHAAHLFQCDEEAVVYGEGKVYASFAPDQAVMTLQQVAFTLWLAWDLAPGMDPGLEARCYFDPPEFNYPFGTHVAIVEVDEQTGQVDFVRYVAVNDFGTVVNPGVVDAQTHGNIGLGVGQALLEEVVYDEDGRPLDRQLFDLPAHPRHAASRLRARPHRDAHAEQPSRRQGGRRRHANPAVAPAVVNAVCDALDLGSTTSTCHCRPTSVWRAMASRGSGSGDHCRPSTTWRPPRSTTRTSSPSQARRGPPRRRPEPHHRPQAGRAEPARRRRPAPHRVPPRHDNGGGRLRIGATATLDALAAGRQPPPGRPP